jgi:hypothetical protein
MDSEGIGGFEKHQIKNIKQLKIKYISQKVALMQACQKVSSVRKIFRG